MTANSSGSAISGRSCGANNTLSSQPPQMHARHGEVGIKGDGGPAMIDGGVEFEAGDPDYPIYSGCFWATGEVPAQPALYSAV